MTPKATVICICYNHEAYVQEALESVVKQTHSDVELIVVDDASTDHSVEKITAFAKEHPETIVIENDDNLGNCASFNKGFALSSGEYIIDLSADDVLHPDRISIGIRSMEGDSNRCGVQYADAEIVNADGSLIGLHSELVPGARRFSTMPTGMIFAEVLASYFICPPTLMIRREVLVALNGYDEQLSYEDFDFLVRSSRAFEYCYIPQVLVKKRKTPTAKSKLQEVGDEEELASTFVVCKKAVNMIQTSEEKNALRRRLAYEARHALRVGRKSIANKYFQLMKDVGFRFQGSFYRLISRLV